MEEGVSALNSYYQEQLRLLRQGARAFARKFPAAAPLLLESGGDPDAERILEGTAFLCAKIHERLDGCAPEVIQSLLREVFPESVMPMPSSAVVKFSLKPGFAEPLFVRRGARLASRPVDGVSCLYSTMRDLSILPLSVVSVESASHGDLSGSVSVSLAASLPLARFLPDSLDFHLSGAYALASDQLLTLMSRLVSADVYAEGRREFSLPASAVKIRRMSVEDLRLPESQSGNRAYMALLRYFCCPDVLTMFSVSGLRRAAFDASARSLRLVFNFGPGVSPLPAFPDGSFALNAVPVSNIFPLHAEPIQADFSREEYRILPHAAERRYVDILAVKNVSAIRRGGAVEVCRPYGLYTQSSDGMIYRVRYSMPDDGDVPEHYISMPRRADSAEDFGGCVLAMDLLCCNRVIPNRLLRGDICVPTDSSPSQATFENIGAPSPMLSPLSDEALQWRFLAQMNANLLPLASAEALRRILALYAPRPSDAPELALACSKRCQAVRVFESFDEERLFRGRLLRGRRLELELDPSGFVSLGDLWLFADSLDQFFAEFASINSYTRLVVRVSGSGERWEWAPRLGTKQLI